MSPQAVDLDEFAAMHSKDECPLDRANRYLIVPDGAEDGKAIPHTRATTVSKALDDGFGVASWTRRLVAIGFAQNPILFGKLCAADPDDKDAIDALCEEAKSKAGGDDAKDNGNILHAFAEKTYKGQKLHIPEPYKTDIDVLHARLDELEIRVVPDYVERYVVNPKLDEPIGGRSDFFGVHFGSTLKVADLKTGNLGPWSWLAFACQLAEYSRAETFYNPKTKSHEPVPEVDQDVGLIIHLPAGLATCDVYFVDLNVGWEAAQLAVAVRAMRKRCKSGGVAEVWTPGRVDNVDVRRARLAERVLALRDAGLGAALVGAWPDGVAYFKAVNEGKAPPHSADELDLIAMAISAVENRNQMPFATPDRADR